MPDFTYVLESSVSRPVALPDGRRRPMRCLTNPRHGRVQTAAQQAGGGMAPWQRSTVVRSHRRHARKNRILQK